MRQKVSPEIFRTESLTRNWKSKYIENKNNELSGVFFKFLEIKIFIKQFIKLYGLTLHNCKIALSSTSLHLIVSYYVTKRASNLINRQHAKKKSKKIDIKKKVIDLIKNISKIYYYKCFFKDVKEEN